MRFLTEKRPRRRKAIRRGGAAVEFAFVAPLLMMVLFGATELGRAMYIQNTVTTAAREGAREASLPSSSEASVTSVVDQYTSQFADINDVDVEISPTIANVESGDTISVSVTVPATSISGWAHRWLGQSFDVESSASMRREGYE